MSNRATPTKTTVDAILYSRVSTDEQADSGLGLADQQKRLHGMATAKGWDATIALVDDGVSAKNLKRPAIADALAMLAAGEAQALVVTKLDRLTRSVRDLGQLMETAEKEGWALVILDLGVDTTTSSGKLVTTVMGAIAEWERDVISERTKAALAVRKGQGKRLGAPISLPHSVRQRIATERSLGSTWQAIADRLNADKVPTVNGGLWRTSTVHKVGRSVALDAEMAALANSVPLV